MRRSRPYLPPAFSRVQIGLSTLDIWIPQNRDFRYFQYIEKIGFIGKS